MDELFNFISNFLVIANIEQQFCIIYWYMTFCERNDLSNCVLRQTRTDIFNNISKTWCLRNQSAVRCNLARINLAIDNGTYLTLQSSRSFAGLLRNRGNGGKKKNVQSLRVKSIQSILRKRKRFIIRVLVNLLEKI